MWLAEMFHLATGARFTAAAFSTKEKAIAWGEGFPETVATVVTMLDVDPAPRKNRGSKVVS